MLVPILNEFQVCNNDEKKCDENEDSFEINFKNAETTEEQHFQIKLKIILPPKCWKSCTSYQLFSLKFYISFDVPIIVKRVLSPE